MFVLMPLSTALEIRFSAHDEKSTNTHRLAHQSTSSFSDEIIFSVFFRKHLIKNSRDSTLEFALWPYAAVNASSFTVQCAFRLHAHVSVWNTVWVSRYLCTYVVKFRLNTLAVSQTKTKSICFYFTFQFCCLFFSSLLRPTRFRDVDECKIAVRVLCNQHQRYAE